LRVLAVNKGTSSLKYLVADVRDGDVTPLRRAQADSIDTIIAAAERDGVDAVGHRMVHGGAKFIQPASIDANTLMQLEGLADLAPLHNPPAVAVIREMLRALPNAPQYVVFDTAFHASLPEVAFTYAVPLTWRQDFAVRRYGFHGLAHRSMAERAAGRLRRPIEELRLVTLQLGSGASACAIAGGRSIDTSMGMTPAEGLVMATRSGDIDPLMAQHLARMGAGTPDDLWATLERSSGLVGLTGENDMKAVIDRAAAGDHDAELAVALVCFRIRKYVGAYLAVLGGADAVVFGGGVGEHSPVVRALALSHFEWAGIELDESANRASVGHEAVISSAGSRVAVLVSPVDEESMICRDVASVAERSPRAGSQL